MGMINFAILSQDPKLVNRANEISQEFLYSIKIYSNVDDMNEQFPAEVFVIDFDKGQEGEKSAQIQLVKYFNPEAFIIVLLSKPVDEKEAEFLKKSGASIFMLREDMLNTSKVDYLSLQVIKTSYLIIKPIDLVVDSVIDFDIYHMMPSNKKYLKLLYSGQKVSAQKKSISLNMPLNCM